MGKWWLYSVLLIIVTLRGGIRIIEQWDGKLTLGKREWCLVYVGCMLCGRCAAEIGSAWMCLCIILGCLMTACITDLLYYKVHNFLWWVSGATATCMVFRLWITRLSDRKFYGELAGLLIFILLQLLFFSKMYGRADCYAFCVCAAAEFGLGMHIFEFLLHMLVAYIILFIIQIYRKNIGKTGNLKASVAFVPYITASFLIILHKYAI